MPLIPQALAELRANPKNHKLGEHCKCPIAKWNSVNDKYISNITYHNKYILTST